MEEFPNCNMQCSAPEEAPRESKKESSFSATSIYDIFIHNNHVKSFWVYLYVLLGLFIEANEFHSLTVGFVLIVLYLHLKAQWWTFYSSKMNTYENVI